MMKSPRIAQKSSDAQNLILNVMFIAIYINKNLN